MIPTCRSSFLLVAMALAVALLASCGPSGPQPAAPAPSYTPIEATPTVLPPATPTPVQHPPTETLAPTKTAAAPAEQLSAQPGSRPVMLAAGAGHTCLLAEGKVRCWGAGQFGQIGAVVDGAFSISGTPVTVKDLPEGVLAIAAGTYHTCALLPFSVLCWGQNDSGQLGERPAGDTSQPFAVAGVSGGQAIAAYGTHTCVITEEGGVVCWGRSASNSGASLANSASPVSIGGLVGKVQALAMGYDFACALNDQGTVQCWGAGTSGQLGNRKLADSPAPLEVTGLPARALAIAAGGYHACAVMEGGSVWCWGGGPDPDPSRPAQIVGFNGPVKALAAGDGHTCALLQDGRVQCLGDNYFGQLGLPPSEPGTGLPSRGKPVILAGIGGSALPAVSIVAGTNHTCALLVDGEIRCWGDLSSGQGGDGSVRWK